MSRWMTIKIKMKQEWKGQAMMTDNVDESRGIERWPYTTISSNEIVMMIASEYHFNSIIILLIFHSCKKNSMSSATRIEYK